MLFDDEIEILEEDKKYPQCYAVPMQRHISIKDIWIPAHLLLNRQKALDSDRIRPNLYHTLSRPEVESFLTYKDTEAKKSFVQLHSLNYNVASACKGKTFDSEYNDKEKSSTYLDSVNVEKESNVDNLQEHNFSSNTQLCDVGANDHNEADSTNSFEIVNKKISGDFMSGCLLEAIKTRDEPPNDYPQLMLNDPAASEVQSNETALSPVDHKNKSSDSLHASNQSQENCLDTIGSETTGLSNTETEFNGGTDSANLLKTVDLGKTSENSTTSSSFEALENLPVAYKKQVVEEQPTKQKRQKEKKKKNAVNKAIQLGEFLESPNVDGYEIPKRDFFYEGLVARGICPPIENPSISKPTNDCYEFPKRDSPPPQKKYASSLFEEFVPNESLLSKEPMKYLVSSEANENSDNVEDGPLTTLVLENVPVGTSKDNIATLMSDYGEIKEVSLVKKGKSSISHVKLILRYDVDVDWITECLNETDPFGASCEKLKCYRI